MKNKRSQYIGLLGGAGVVLAALHLAEGNITKCKWKVYKTYKDCITENNFTNCELHDSQWMAYVCPKNYQRRKYERIAKSLSRRGGFGSGFHSGS